MIIVDTSIWIEFFRQNPDYVSEMTSLLENKRVITIEPIFAELIYGAKNTKEKNMLMAYWKVLPRIRFNEGFLLGSAEFANANNFQNSGIGLIDAVISKATIQSQSLLWTLDKRILNTLEKKYLYK